MPNGIKRTAKQYMLEVAEKNPTIKPLEKYKTSSEPIKHKCLLCSHVWPTKPVYILGGSGCPLCAQKKRANAAKKACKGKLKYSRKQFIGYLHKNYGNKYEVGDIGRMEDRVTLRCKLGHTWTPIAVEARVGRTGCPDCSRMEQMHGNFARKAYKLGRKQVSVQGLEPVALDYLIKREGIKPKDIAVSSMKKVPIIEYVYKGKKRKHYPDIFIAIQNRIIEVKGLWTFGMSGNKGRSLFYANQAKARAAIELGFKYSIYVMRQNGEPLKLPKNWYNLKYSEIKRVVVR